MKIKLKRKQAILLILLIAVFIAASSVFFSGQNSYENKTSSVKLGTIQNTLEETGTVYSKRINTFYSDASRRVEVINVSTGDKVKKGTIILTYENDYDLEIERANKQIEAITATYNEAVKGVDFKEISDMKLNISNIETALSAARNHFEKIKSSKTANEPEYKEAENNVNSLENQLQEAKSNYDLTMQGASSNEKKQYEEQVEEIISQIKMLEQNIEQASIKAEFDGIITQLNVKQGDMTQTGVPVVEIQDETSLGVYVEVSEEDAARAAIGMPFIISNGKESRKLKIDRINQKHVVSESGSDIPQNLVRIEADLDDASSFKTGSKPVVIIVLEEKKDVLLIDRHALNEKNKKQYVTVIDRGRKLEKEITTGLKNNEYAEVTSGLNENEFVLIE